MGLHQAVVAEVASIGDAELFFFLPELIYFCSLLLPCALRMQLAAPPEQLGASGY